MTTAPLYHIRDLSAVPPTCIFFIWPLQVNHPFVSELPKGTDTTPGTELKMLLLKWWIVSTWTRFPFLFSHTCPRFDSPLRVNSRLRPYSTFPMSSCLSISCIEKAKVFASCATKAWSSSNSMYATIFAAGARLRSCFSWLSMTKMDVVRCLVRGHLSANKIERNFYLWIQTEIHFNFIINSIRWFSIIHQIKILFNRNYEIGSVKFLQSFFLRG